MKVRIFFLFFLVAFCFLKGELLFSGSAKKEKLKSDQAIDYFCSKIDPGNPFCQKRMEVKLRRLELKSLIYQDFESFCKINPINKFCLTKKVPSIYTLCNNILAYTSHCREWQELKQAELENKGLLSEEIERFCRRFPQNHLCK